MIFKHTFITSPHHSAAPTCGVHNPPKPVLRLVSTTALSMVLPRLCAPSTVTHTRARALTHTHTQPLISSLINLTSVVMDDL